jgi:hypothetical protein
MSKMGRFFNVADIPVAINGLPDYAPKLITQLLLALRLERIHTS